MTLQQIHYIITIAEYGSLNKAAEKLFVAQPSLTCALKELEKEVGITIFNRTGRGVTPTPDGAEFLLYARQVYGQYETLVEKYENPSLVKRKFGVSTQHYSFAVKAFVEMAKQCDTNKYELAIRETKTRDVIEDVSRMRSEVGILYISDYNRKIISKLLAGEGLVFTPLIDCKAYIYLWKGHPLADRESIDYASLADYPCLSLEQGEDDSFYFAEEILVTNEYPRIIKTRDRATMLNLMIGLNGYTICAGIVCEELNGSEYVAVPYKDDAANPNCKMEIGYITRKNSILSKMGDMYINELKRYLAEHSDTVEQ